MATTCCFAWDHCIDVASFTLNIKISAMQWRGRRDLALIHGMLSFCFGHLAALASRGGSAYVGNVGAVLVNKLLTVVLRYLC